MTDVDRRDYSVQGLVLNDADSWEGGMSLSAVLLAGVLAVSDVSDYERSDCSDPDALDNWMEVLDRQLDGPNADVFVRLHALRTGLCAMLKTGLIRYDQAVDIFDHEHVRSIDELMRRGEEDSERQHEEGLSGEDVLL